MLVSELNAADAERKQELKRQKRLHKKLKKNKPELPAAATTTTTTTAENQQQSDESSSDWIIDYDINQVSKLTDEIRRTSVTMTNEDKTEKVNLILTKIKKQQDELRKLRQNVRRTRSATIIEFETNEFSSKSRFTFKIIQSSNSSTNGMLALFRKNLF